MGDANFPPGGLAPGAGLRAAIGSAFLATLISGCLSGGDGGRRAVKVKTELLRAEGRIAAPKQGSATVRPEAASASPGAASARTGAASAPQVAAGPAWSSDLSIASLKVPILKISLHNAAFTREAELYACAGTGSECLVEAAGELLQNELDAAPVAVEKDEYRFVQVKTCEDSESGYASGITATVALAGRTWYTHPSLILDSAGPARPLFIRTQGCGRLYALPQPLIIDDSSAAEVTFKLYFDIEELAYAALGSNATSVAWSPGNCAGDRPAGPDSAGTPFLCLAYPGFSGIADTAAVALERYRLNGAATLGLFFTGGSDRPMGGYLRRTYREGEPANPAFDLAVFGSAVFGSAASGGAVHGGADSGRADTGGALPIRDLRKNGDGTLYLAAFGSGPRGMDGSAFRVYAFQRGGHSGVFSALPDTAGMLATGSYIAVRLIP